MVKWRKQQRVCIGCGGPRSALSAKLCRSCYEGKGALKTITLLEPQEAPVTPPEAAPQPSARRQAKALPPDWEPGDLRPATNRLMAGR